LSEVAETAPGASEADVEKLHAKIGQLRDASVRLGLIRGGKTNIGRVHPPDAPDPRAKSKCQMELSNPFLPAII